MDEHISEIDQIEDGHVVLVVPSLRLMVMGRALADPRACALSVTCQLRGSTQVPRDRCVEPVTDGHVCNALQFRGKRSGRCCVSQQHSGVQEYDQRVGIVLARPDRVMHKLLAHERRATCSWPRRAWHKATTGMMVKTVR